MLTGPMPPRANTSHPCFPAQSGHGTMRIASSRALPGAAIWRFSCGISAPTSTFCRPKPTPGRFSTSRPVRSYHRTLRSIACSCAWASAACSSSFPPSSSRAPRRGPSSIATRWRKERRIRTISVRPSCALSPNTPPARSSSSDPISVTPIRSASFPTAVTSGLTAGGEPSPSRIDRPSPVDRALHIGVELLLAEPAHHVSAQTANRVEVLWQQIVGLHRKAVGFFGEEHQLQHARRVHDAQLQQRFVVADPRDIAVIEEVLLQEITDLLANERLIYRVCLRIHNVRQLPHKKGSLPGA